MYELTKETIKGALDGICWEEKDNDCHTFKGIVIEVKGIGRRQVLTIKTTGEFFNNDQRNMLGDGQLMMLGIEAMEYCMNNEYGWYDMDAVRWSIIVDNGGHNDWDEEGYEYIQTIIIECLDWMS